MREILFRGQTRRLGELVRMNGEKVPSKWVYGGICQGTGAFSIIYGSMDSELESPTEKHVIYTDTIGQYTGLTDKNGKKIFEGDILEVDVRETELIPDDWIYATIGTSTVRKRDTGRKIKALWTVEYKEHRCQGNGFYVYGKDRRFHTTLTQSTIWNANPVVVGNIYDNPDLLKGGEEE